MTLLQYSPDNYLKMGFKELRKYGKFNRFIVTVFLTVSLLLFMVFVASTVMVVYSHREVQSLRGELYELKLASQQERHRARRQATLHEVNEHHIHKRSAGDYLNQSFESEPKIATGSSFVRWGRMDCPGESINVYSGYAAGAYNTHTGGGANMLCITYNMTYQEGEYVNGFQSSSYLYGAEWKDNSGASNSLFDFSDVNSGSMYLQTLSCATCLAKRRTTNIMIPGKSICPDGWHEEYNGYIMASGHSDKHSSQYICVDRRPQPIPGTEGSQPGLFLYVSEANCPSMPCGPAVHGREFRCIVCSI